MKRELMAMIKKQGIRRFRKSLVAAFNSLSEDAFLREGDERAGDVYAEAAERVEELEYIIIPKGTKV